MNKSYVQQALVSLSFYSPIALQLMIFPQPPAYNPRGADLHTFKLLSKGIAHQAHKKKKICCIWNGSVH